MRSLEALTSAPPASRALTKIERDHGANKAIFPGVATSRRLSPTPLSFRIADLDDVDGPVIRQQLAMIATPAG